jgi:hypothetical protein
MPRIPLVLVAIASLTACAGPHIVPALSPARANREALLVLPGFGYGRGDGDAFRAIAKRAPASGLDVYVPSYVTRGGLEDTRRALRQFIRGARLDRYERVHVVAFIAGAWTVNPLIDGGELPNLATIVYDRSPFQERAPALAVRDLRIPAWLRYGRTIFDLSATPYPPLARSDVKVGLLIETMPTRFVRKHARPADVPAADAFACDRIEARFDDCLHVAMTHDDVYTRFADVWPDVDAFIRSGRFLPRAR